MCSLASILDFIFQDFVHYMGALILIVAPIAAWRGTT